MALLYKFPPMAVIETMAASSYPLDLTTLKEIAENSIRECVLIPNGRFDRTVHGLFSKDRMPSQETCIGLVLDPNQPMPETEITDLFEKGVRLILWEPVAAQPDIQIPSLLISSRAGLWNHLIFPGEEEAIDTRLLEFVLNNPNIVHSYSFDARSIAPRPANRVHLVESLSGYRNVQSLPGVPIWKKMDMPEHLLCFLNTFGLKQVQKWLVMSGTGMVHCLGNAIEYHYSPSADLPEGYFDEICRMVEAGGSVNMQKVRFNLERAFLIGYAVEFGLVVGNSSLKEPRPEYIQSLNRNTGGDFSGFLERGYTSVRPEYRGLGIGTRLLEGLTKRKQGRKLYSIISEDNLATQKIAIRNKTRKLTTFFSQKTGKQVGVWVKD